MTDGTDSSGRDMLIERALKSEQMQVAVHAAELFARLGHPCRAPEQGHVAGLPVLDVAAVGLLTVAEDAAVDPGIRDLAARTAIAHAVLTLSPRTAPRFEPQPQHAGNGLPPHLTWGDE